jgi:hypothetical protein
MDMAQLYYREKERGWNKIYEDKKATHLAAQEAAGPGRGRAVDRAEQMVDLAEGNLS